ncbi:MAG: (2Fe-2S)-binding protein, partial [Dermatophilaceae bacterium]
VDPDAGHRVVSLKDPDGGRYVEVVVAGGRLVGATCIGDATVAAALSALYTRGLPVPDDPALLMVRTLTGANSVAAHRDPGDLADDDRVCTCNSVSAGRVRDAVRAGCASVADVARETRASTGCGDCASVVAGLLASTDTEPLSAAAESGRATAADAPAGAAPGTDLDPTPEPATIVRSAS